MNTGKLIAGEELRIGDVVQISDEDGLVYKHEQKKEPVFVAPVPIKKGDLVTFDFYTGKVTEIIRKIKRKITVVYSAFPFTAEKYNEVINSDSVKNTWDAEAEKHD